MAELSHPFPPSVIRLFDASAVNAACAWGVLEGNVPGVIAVDSLSNPTWAVGRMHWNLGFAAGAVDCAEAAAAATQLARWGEFGIFRAHGDPDIPGSQAAVARLEFVGRRRATAASKPSLPDGCRIVPADLALLKRSQWGEGTALIWGGAERFVERGIGFYLVREDDILCEVPAFSIGAGKAEISVITHPDHRGKGFAKLTCRYFADACEQRGLMPTYSCDRENLASVAVARSLGFPEERECRRVQYRREPGGDSPT
jgi:RimJ/RimL family protein N-acetyltransferase